MRIDILTAVPNLLDSPFAHSIMKRAQQKGLLEVYLHNIRDYSTSKQKSIDDYQFGGGAGMVLMIEPIVAALEKLKFERTYDEIIYLTPDGQTLNQPICNKLSMKKNLLLLCGHYKVCPSGVK